MADDTSAATPSFKPSQVEIHTVVRADTIGNTRLAGAAALIVRVCQARGDAWQGVTYAMVREVIDEDIEAKREPFASLVRSQFFRPDVVGLGLAGFTRCGIADGKATFTEKGFAALAKHVRAVALPSPASKPPLDATPLDLLNRLAFEQDLAGLITVPTAVKALAAWREAIGDSFNGFDPLTGARDYVQTLAAVGHIELYPGTGAALSDEDRALCPVGVDCRPFVALRVLS